MAITLLVHISQRGCEDCEALLTVGVLGDTRVPFVQGRNLRLMLSSIVRKFCELGQ